eukprot:2200541-Ditylum_brightwellii.AAC.1
MISEEESYDDVDENNETNAWRTASKHLHRLSTVLHSIRQKEGDGYNVAIRSPKGEHILAQALAKAVRCCTEAGQPQTGLCMVQQAASIVKASAAASSLLQSKQSPSSMKEAVKSFFGLDDESDDDELLLKNVNNDIAIDPDFVMSTDMLLAAIMEAYRVIGRDKDALDLFLTKYEHMHENESLRLMSEKKKKGRLLSSMHGSKEEDEQ